MTHALGTPGSVTLRHRRHEEAHATEFGALHFMNVMSLK